MKEAIVRSGHGLAWLALIGACSAPAPPAVTTNEGRSAAPTVAQSVRPPAPSSVLAPPGSASATRTPEAATPPEAERLLAFGNEPFWSVAVEAGALRWKTPDNPSGLRLPATRQPTLQGFRWAGRADGRDYALDILPGACSDGMSDRRHAYRATWTYDGDTLQGCARRADAAPGE